MPTTELLGRFHAVLVDEIRAHRPELLTSPFTVAEIYQELVPYRTHRDRIGVEMNGDYEHLLIRLLAGEGDYLVLDAEAGRQELRNELESNNPNTGLFREYAAADVRLNPDRVPEGGGAVEVEFLAPTGPESSAGEDTTTEEEGSDPGLFDDAHQPAAEAAPEETMAPKTAAETIEEKEGGDEAAACAWCRATLPKRENLNYCPFCGTDVHVIPCPSCGEALEPDWRFCIACGAGAAAG